MKFFIEKHKNLRAFGVIVGGEDGGGIVIFFWKWILGYGREGLVSTW